MNPKNRTYGHVLDLTNPHVLSHLGYKPNQILGPIGALTLDELKRDAKNAGKSHCAYRDPLRPGKLWVEDLNAKETNREIWQTLETASLVDRLLPGMIKFWQKETRPPVDWDLFYPPLSTPPLEYVQALEWLSGRYPDVVVIWVELALTYENDLKIAYALESLIQDCKKMSKTWRITAEVLGCGESLELDYSAAS